LLKSDLLADPYLSKIITTAFPANVIKQFQQAIYDHPLHKDIIATQLSNKIINEMGITFVYRIQMETGSTVADIIRAYSIASEVFDAAGLRSMILALDFKIPLNVQYEMLYHIRTLINLATRWFLYSPHLRKDLGKVIDHFAPRVKKLEELVPVIMSGRTKDYMAKLTKEFSDQGLPQAVAKTIATHRAMYTTLNIIEVATEHKFDLLQTAKVYFTSGERLNLLWFRDQIATDSREGHWNVLARLTLRDELDYAQRTLSVAVMKVDKKETDTNLLIDKWMKKNAEALGRWHKLLSMLHDSNTTDYTMFFIALRELFGFIQAGDRAQ
jgi:glutamate dehydrogenase